MGILASLFSNLASDSAPRIRLVAKFVELDYEKVDRLLEMRESAETRLIAEERHILDERQVSTPAHAADILGFSCGRRGS